jgi:ribosomal protein L36
MKRGEVKRRDEMNEEQTRREGKRRVINSDPQHGIARSV